MSIFRLTWQISNADCCLILCGIHIILATTALESGMTGNVIRRRDDAVTEAALARQRETR